jgi:hypothetical protein
MYSVPPARRTVTLPPLGEFTVALKLPDAKSTCPDPVTVAFCDEPAELFAWIVSTRRNAAVFWLVLAA